MCGFNTAAGGGDTGNLNGDLTAPFYPRASAAHTLVDGTLEQTDTDEITQHGNLEVLGNIHSTGQADIDGNLTVAGITLLDDDTEVNGTLTADHDLFVLGNFHAQAGAVFLGHVEFNGSGDVEANGPVVLNDLATFNDVIVINKRTQNRYEALAIVTGDVDVDASLSNWFDLAVGADAEFQVPTNPIQGGVMQVRVRMGGAFAVTFDETPSGGYRFANGEEPVFAVTDATYYLFFEWNDLDTVWDCVGGPRGPFGGS